MKRLLCRLRAALLALALPLSIAQANAATDPEIDRLLKKLPPPEKLVKRDPRAMNPSDPALRDPLAAQIDAAVRGGKRKRAAEHARQLAARHPRSAIAHAIHGFWVLDQKRYAEASSAFRRALALQPQVTFCHYLLAVSEYEQKHFQTALPHIRRVTQQEPSASAAWMFLSVCAEAAGRLPESLSAARRVTALAPREPVAWLRLAKAEGAMGNQTAANNALRRAIEMARAQAKVKPASRPAKKTR
ncbi:MAG TPA: tetratricopeptide repeat protein [Chthoniobacterales bacterium]|nr:tetratricopeptide repeat protein [Chthoniobacterales bacterium]